MHNIDRTRLETSWGAESYGTNGYEYEYEPEYEYEYEFESSSNSFGMLEYEGPFSEAEEMELAAELLGITDEAELDQFIGKLIRGAASKVQKAIGAPVGQALGSAVKGIAKKGLSAAGAIAGNVLLPGVGGAVGAKLGSAAERMFGLELEGLSPEDQEYEVARSIVRFAGDAAQKAATAPHTVPPQAIVRKAVTEAAQKHAPGLMTDARSRPQQGTWKRHGHTIVLIGV